MRLRRSPRFAYTLGVNIGVHFEKRLYYICCALGPWWNFQKLRERLRHARESMVEVLGRILDLDYGSSMLTWSIRNKQSGGWCYKGLPRLFSWIRNFETST